MARDEPGRVQADQPARLTGIPPRNLRVPAPRIPFAPGLSMSLSSNSSTLRISLYDVFVSLYDMSLRIMFALHLDGTDLESDERNSAALLAGTSGERGGGR